MAVLHNVSLRGVEIHPGHLDAAGLGLRHEVGNWIADGELNHEVGIVGELLHFGRHRLVVVVVVVVVVSSRERENGIALDGGGEPFALAFATNLTRLRYNDLAGNCNHITVTTR